MINQINAWLNNNFNPIVEGKLPPSKIVVFAIGLTGDLICVRELSKYLGFLEPLNILFILITMAVGSLITNQFYITMANTIAQKCNHLSTILLNSHDLQPNPSFDRLIPGYMSTREIILAIILGLIGGASGSFLSGATLDSFLCVVGLPENIDPFICLAPAMLLGGTPGYIFGFTVGRLVEHAPEIISKRPLYQQARAIITLNDLPSNLKQNRYLPPEILGIIHSYLIGTSEQASTRIINKVIDERNNNICSMVNNKINFFASRSRQARQLIEDKEDNFESTPMYHPKNS